MTPKEKLDKLKRFIRVLDESDYGPIFALNCTIAGISDCATLDFFNNTLLPFIYAKGVRRCDLKYQMHLRQNLAKLNKFYQEMSAVIQDKKEGGPLCTHPQENNNILSITS